MHQQFLEIFLLNNLVMKLYQYLMLMDQLHHFVNGDSLMIRYCGEFWWFELGWELKIWVGGTNIDFNHSAFDVVNDIWTSKNEVSFMGFKKNDEPSQKKKIRWNLRWFCKNARISKFEYPLKFFWELFSVITNRQKII